MAKMCLYRIRELQFRVYDHGDHVSKGQEKTSFIEGTRKVEGCSKQSVAFHWLSCYQEEGSSSFLSCELSAQGVGAPPSGLSQLQLIEFLFISFLHAFTNTQLAAYVCTHEHVHKHKNYIKVDLGNNKDSYVHDQMENSFFFFPFFFL